MRPLAAADIRPEIAEDFQRLYRKALSILEEACDGKNKYAELCDCGRRVQIGYPKVKDITEALKFLAEQGMGKPTAQQTPPPKIDTTKTDIARATDDELAAIAQQQDEMGATP